MYRKVIQDNDRNILDIALTTAYDIISAIERPFGYPSDREPKIKLIRGTYTYKKDDIATCTIMEVSQSRTIAPWLVITITVLKQKSKIIIIAETHTVKIEDYNDTIERMVDEWE